MVSPCTCMRGNHIVADDISSNDIAGESYQLLTFVRILKY